MLLLLGDPTNVPVFRNIMLLLAPKIDNREINSKQTYIKEKIF